MIWFIELTEIKKTDTRKGKSIFFSVLFLKVKFKNWKVGNNDRLKREDYVIFSSYVLNILGFMCARMPCHGTNDDIKLIIQK